MGDRPRGPYGPRVFDEVALREMAGRGCHVGEIAAVLGRAPNTIRSKAAKLRITIRPHVREEVLTEAQVRQLAELAAARLGSAAIAKEMGLTVKAVRNQAQRRGIRIPRPKKAPSVSVRVEDEVFRALSSTARLRGTTPMALARHLLATIVRDRMVSAILDGEKTPSGRRPPRRSPVRQPLSIAEQMAPQLEARLI